MAKTGERSFQRDATRRAASSSREVGNELKIFVLVHSTNAQMTPGSLERVLSICELPNISSVPSVHETTAIHTHHVGAHNVVARVLRDDAAQLVTYLLHSTIESGVSREGFPSSSLAARKLA